jgi:DNA repair exonuclease SbcCD ATPase subunit
MNMRAYTSKNKGAAVILLEEMVKNNELDRVEVAEVAEQLFRREWCNGPARWHYEPVTHRVVFDEQYNYEKYCELEKENALLEARLHASEKMEKHFENECNRLEARVNEAIKDDKLDGKRIEELGSRVRVLEETMEKRREAYFSRAAEMLDVSEKDRVEILHLKTVNERLEKENAELQRYVNELSNDETLHALQKENASLLHKQNELSNQIATGNAICERMEKENEYLKRTLKDDPDAVKKILDQAEELKRLNEKYMEQKRIAKEAGTVLLEAHQRIDNLEKENAELRAKDQSMTDFYHAKADSDEAEIAELRKGHGVVWEKTLNVNGATKLSGNMLGICFDGMKCAIPLPPADKDEALEAFAQHQIDHGVYPLPDQNIARKEFIAGFKSGRSK